MSEREFEEFLRELSKHLGRDGARGEIVGELRDHLEERFAELSLANVSRDEALRLALDEFGEPPVLAQNFAVAGRQRRRRMASWSGAAIVALTTGIVVLWAMWPERARVPLGRSLVAQTETAEPAREAALPEAEAKVEQALAKSTTVDFVDTPLMDVASFLVDLHDIAITIDGPSLENQGMSSDEPVTLRAQNLRLETVLDRLASDLNLTWTYRDEAIELTTVDAERSQASTRVYQLDDLLAVGTNRDAKRSRDQGAEIVNILEASIGPAEWESSGGMGKAVFSEGALIVTQSWRMQRKIGQFLFEARKAAALASAKPSDPKTMMPISLPLPLDAERQIVAALKKTTTVDFVDTSLNDVCAFLQDQHGISFVLDRRALDDAGVASDTPMTIKSQGGSLQALLNRLTRSRQLTWTIAHDAIVITNPEALGVNYLTTRLYPVGDLVAAEDQESRVAAVEALVELIKNNLGRTTSAWIESGGSGSAQALTANSTIVIGQTVAVHREVEKLLTDLRKTRSSGSAILKAPDVQTMVIQVHHVQRAESEQPLDMSALEEMIKVLVEPESWTKDPRAYVRHVGSRLVIRQTPACQRKISKFLTGELGFTLYPIPPGTMGGGGGFF